jgi:hypothetical protein
VIVGGDISDGGNGVTGAVALDCAAVDPAAFAAVTTERILDPTSSACNV